MNKLLIQSMLLLVGFYPQQSHSFLQHTVKLSPEDRTALAKAEASFKDAAESLRMLAQQIEQHKISKMLTQAGVVIVSTSTAVLSAYAVFLIIKYELEQQPDSPNKAKALNWKTILAGAIGSGIFAGSILALVQSEAIANFTIKV